MKMNLNSPRDAKYFWDRWDLSNVVAFCCGAKQRLIADSQRRSELFSVSTLISNEDLCYLRALCATRNAFLSNYDALRRTLNEKVRLFDHFPFPPYARPVFESHNNYFFSEDSLTVKEQFQRLNDEIVRQAEVLRDFIPEEEEHPEWVLELFSFPVMSDEALLELAKGYSANWNHYPMRCWQNLDHVSPDLFRTDYTLMFEVYRANGEQLINWQSYKGGPRITRLPKVNYQKLAVGNDSLEYMKGMLSNDDCKIAVIDTQNLSPFWTFKFLDWIQEEYPDSISKVVMFVDGKEHWQWGKAEAVLPYTVERVDSPRVLKGKSTVDSTLIICLMKLYYESQCSTFFVFSGDCDFLPLITALPDATLCFCGLSGGTSRRTINFANSCNAKFIVMDEFLKSINYGVSPSVSIVDDVVDRLNQKELDVSSLVTSTTEACSYVGRKVDTVVATTLLNEILSTFTIRVTADGFLRFEKQKQTQQRGVRAYGTDEP